MLIKDIQITPLKVIPGQAGDILHVLKQTDPLYSGFGEAYFSTIKKGEIKAWKRHRRMTLNLAVPSGEVKFVMYDDRDGSPTLNEISETILSPLNYKRLTIPPMIWLGFKGIGDGLNIVLNIADIPHDPEEVDRLEVFSDYIKYEW